MKVFDETRAGGITEATLVGLPGQGDVPGLAEEGADELAAILERPRAVHSKLLVHACHACRLGRVRGAALQRGTFWLPDLLLRAFNAGSASEGCALGWLLLGALGLRGGDRAVGGWWQQGLLARWQTTGLGLLVLDLALRRHLRRPLAQGRERHQWRGQDTLHFEEVLRPLLLQRLRERTQEVQVVLDVDAQLVSERTLSKETKHMVKANRATKWRTRAQSSRREISEGLTKGTMSTLLDGWASYISRYCRSEAKA